MLTVVSERSELKCDEGSHHQRLQTMTRANEAMHFLKLILRNALRHKLRTALTVLGLVVASCRSACCNRSSTRGIPAPKRRRRTG